jgi:hypothetical protein
VQLERLIAYKSLVWGAGQARVGGVSLKVYTPVDDGSGEWHGHGHGCRMCDVR